MTLRSDKDIKDYLVCLETTLSDDGKPLREPYLTIFRVWPFAGLRLDEMCSLEKIHVGEMMVPVEDGSASVPWRTFHVAHGKGDKYRDVGVLPSGGFVLAHYLKTWAVGRKGTTLWPISRADKPAGRMSVMRRFKWVSKRFGARITSHTMRRTYATLLIRKGVPIETVSAMLGHENIQTTINFYVSLGFEDHLRKIGKAFNLKTAASEVDSAPDTNPQTKKNGDGK
jgi:site-specific recombinase XerD